jgi:NitT/TauT family transport system substrate-binding protein
MHMMQDRRRFLTTLSSAGAAGLVGTPTSFAQEAPPETTTIRLTNIPGICIAPQYMAEELLKSEGFTDVQYVDVVNTDIYPAFASSMVDISMAFVAPFIVQIDRKVPIVLLGGIHVGCFELFGQERVRAIRDLKGKVVAVPSARPTIPLSPAWWPMSASTPIRTSILSPIPCPNRHGF